MTDWTTRIGHVDVEVERTTGIVTLREYNRSMVALSWGQIVQIADWLNHQGHLTRDERVAMQRVVKEG